MKKLARIMHVSYLFFFVSYSLPTNFYLYDINRVYRITFHKGRIITFVSYRSMHNNPLVMEWISQLMRNKTQMIFNLNIRASFNFLLKFTKTRNYPFIITWHHVPNIFKYHYSFITKFRTKSNVFELVWSLLKIHNENVDIQLL